MADMAVRVDKMVCGVQDGISGQRDYPGRASLRRRSMQPPAYDTRCAGLRAELWGSERAARRQPGGRLFLEHADDREVYCYARLCPSGSGIILQVSHEWQVAHSHHEPRRALPPVDLFVE